MNLKHEGNYTKKNYKLFKASDKERAFKTARWNRHIMYKDMYIDVQG